jgi:hypothetical protein
MQEKTRAGLTKQALLRSPLRFLLVIHNVACVSVKTTSYSAIPGALKCGFQATP